MAVSAPHFCHVDMYAMYPAYTLESIINPLRNPLVPLPRFTHDRSIQCAVVSSFCSLATARRQKIEGRRLAGSA